MRYAMRIAEYRESSDLLTQMALRGYPLSMFASVCLFTQLPILMRLKFLTEFLSLNTKECRSIGPRSGHCVTLHQGNCVISLGKQPLPSKFHSLFKKYLNSAPEVKQDHPLNLSISVSGGKETNKDCLSSGEWTGKSSKWKSVADKVTEL